MSISITNLKCNNNDCESCYNGECLYPRAYLHLGINEICIRDINVSNSVYHKCLDRKLVKEIERVKEIEVIEPSTESHLRYINDAISSLEV